MTKDNLQINTSLLLGKCIGTVRLLWAVIALLLLLCGAARAQYVTNGADPASATWSHIYGKHFDVIFPDSIRVQGEHFTRLLNKVYVPASLSMKYQPRRVPVILHPYNLQSNGMVVWAPSRMEIITTAPSDGYGQPWLEQLALHEYRHVVQTDMMNRGFTRGLYYLLGEQAVALPSALVQPWLFEGDAVSNETAMSYTGRGRMPSFSMGLRTIALSGKKYSYSKYLLGSYKDYIPNRYEYGYQMTAYGKYRYGADLWGKVFAYSGSYPFLIFTQSLATKKYTGKNSINFHREAKLFLDSMWSAQMPLPVDNAQPMLSAKELQSGDYVDYSNVVVLPDDRVYAKKYTLSRTPMLVRIRPDGKTGKVAMLGSMSSKLVGGRSAIFWTEYSPDLRWEQKNYSELWRYNARRNKSERLTFGTSYFTPAVSDGGRIAVSEKFVSGEQAIILLDSAYQKSEEILRLPLGTSVNDIAWISDENMAVLLVSAQGMSIDVVNVRAKKLESLLPHTYAEISSIYAVGGKIFFSTGYDGVNNIYALDVRSKAVHKLTREAYGAFTPQLSANGVSMFYISYGANGGKPVRLPVDSLMWEQTTFDAPMQIPLVEDIARQEGFVLDTAKLDTSALDVRPYSKLKHLFRFHSWAPFSFSSSDVMNGDFSSAAVGVTLMSQNNLSTAFTSLGYKYNQGFNSVNASFTYAGWYPVVELSGSYGTRYRNYYVLDGSSPSYRSEDLYGEMNLTAYVPLTLGESNLVSSIVPYFQLQLTNDQLWISDSKSFSPEISANTGLSARVATRMAIRDINPRWGISASANMQSSVYSFNQKWSLAATAYLPGILANNSIKLYAGYEQQRLPLLYDTRLVKPRGFVFSGGVAAPIISSLSANYALPLWYPDLSLGFFAYVKRVRINGFVDYMTLAYDEGTNAGIKRMQLASYSSFGYEAMFDFHLFRFPVLISAGWRQTFTDAYVDPAWRSAATQTTPFEFLLSVSY